MERNLTPGKAVSIVRDFMGRSRPGSCKYRGCPREGLQYLEEYTTTHRYDLMEHGAVVHREIAQSDFGVPPTRITVFCPACGSRVTTTPDLIPTEVVRAAAVIRSAGPGYNQGETAEEPVFPGCEPPPPGGGPWSCRRPDDIKVTFPGGRCVMPALPTPVPCACGVQPVVLDASGMYRRPGSRNLTEWRNIRYVRCPQCSPPRAGWDPFGDCGCWGIDYASAVSAWNASRARDLARKVVVR